MQVEKAPIVIKSGLSKADAEAMQKQLEAGEHLHTVDSCSQCTAAAAGVRGTQCLQSEAA